MTLQYTVQNDKIEFQFSSLLNFLAIHRKKSLVVCKDQKLVVVPFQFWRFFLFDGRPPKWDFELEIRPEQAWTSKTSWIVVILYNLTCVAWPRTFQKVVNCQRRMPKCLGLFFGHSLLILTSNCQKAFFKSLKGFFLAQFGSFRIFLSFRFYVKSI